MAIAAARRRFPAAPGQTAAAGGGATTDFSPEPALPTPGVYINDIDAFSAPALDGMSIEEAIRAILQSSVFSPNDAATWGKVTAAVSSQLTVRWKNGELVGTSSADAFSVACGLGSTMTGTDIADGYLRLATTLRRAGSAEAVELTFTQEMQPG